VNLSTISLAIPVPAVQGRFGDRIATYTTQLNALDIRKILGHDPRSKYWKMQPERIREMYSEVQRATTPERSRNLINYIKRGIYEGVTSALPAISIGVSKACKFDPHDANGAIGNMFVPDDAETVVLDGLGRLTAMFDLADEGSEGLKLTKQLTIAVTFFAPVGDDELDDRDFGQLFADFNFRQQAVPARIALNLEQNDVYVQLTDAVAREPFVSKHGGIERKAASLGKKSTAIVVQTVLLRAVRGATEGRDFQEKNIATAARPNLTKTTFDQELEYIREFFSEISSRMGARWDDRESLHLSAPGWQALGVICHDVHHRGLDLTPAERSRIYDVIATIDWTRTNPDWVDVAKLGTRGSDGRVVIRGAGRNNTQHIIDYVRSQTGLATKLLAHDRSPQPAMA
jgi:DGQHR domain-containing protein